MGMSTSAWLVHNWLLQQYHNVIYIHGIWAHLLDYNYFAFALINVHWQTLFDAGALPQTNSLSMPLSRAWGLHPIDQSHRYGRPQAACREPAGSYDKTTRTAICFEHKTQYLLIRAPYTRIVVFWHISNIPPMISQSLISCNTPTFYIAAIFVKYCYTTGSWLL